jgi:hypothetical protein
MVEAAGIGNRRMREHSGWAVIGAIIMLVAGAVGILAVVEGDIEKGPLKLSSSAKTGGGSQRSGQVAGAPVGRLAGIWAGNLVQGQGPSRHEFQFSLNLGQVESRIQGTSRIVSGSNEGTMELAGTFDGTICRFQEKKLLSSKRNTGYWVFKKVELHYSAGPPETLRGTWSAPEDIKGGMIQLTRATGVGQ